MYRIDCRDQTKRRELFEFLKSKGYNIVMDNGNEESQKESIFPIFVYPKDKSVAILNNVTRAAAAVSSGCLISVEDFYKEFKE